MHKARVKREVFKGILKTEIIANVKHLTGKVF